MKTFCWNSITTRAGFRGKKRKELQTTWKLVLTRTIIWLTLQPGELVYSSSSNFVVSFCHLADFRFSPVYAVCPGSRDPFYAVSYYKKWVTTSWTYSRFATSNNHIFVDCFAPMNSLSSSFFHFPHSKLIH